ncbi:hypothetical protein DY000_02007708 [Brassica cretica]|uniref:Uncharacterized protein n=1 Tax=Brassica cretica TaxID=69181 RepID=A0ABQ7C977_BRACR|nr:hypothetical protein DY000_02007708 [Brassica cretica]
MFKAIILMDRNWSLSRINWELFWVSTRRFWGRIRKLKIWFEWRLILITIKAESRLYEGCISGYACKTRSRPTRPRPMPHVAQSIPGPNL